MVVGLHFGAAAARCATAVLATCLGGPYPSHFLPVEVQRLQKGFSSPHFTLRILASYINQYIELWIFFVSLAPERTKGMQLTCMSGIPAVRAYHRSYTVARSWVSSSASLLWMLRRVFRFVGSGYLIICSRHTRQRDALGGIF